MFENGGALGSFDELEVIFFFKIVNIVVKELVNMPINVLEICACKVLICFLNVDVLINVLVIEVVVVIKVAVIKVAVIKIAVVNT